MKDAYVLEHHYGDNGDTPAGSILTEVSSKRFEELQKKGLVREATAAEVKAGFKPTIAADESQPESGGGGEKKAQDPANKKAADPANKGA
ncbi:hypothetical protein [Sphingomonas sp. Leaf242]|uniref:hypothetical protein n=1 Tax=Sphingomonas sp. Leaf242 TaxID=1736304 RepID=UPI000715AB30|nr:hypothetical protein [Sphingomonas sp. Leaf242]KQO13274.1 hypothetical protein ASF09_03225 [Sphingomonas sp. Leaf242]